MARNSNVVAVESETDDGVSLASVIAPVMGDTLAEQFSALTGYIVGKAGDRYPNLLSPIQVMIGQPVDEFIAAVANSQFTARARNAAKDEASIEAAFAKACAWRPTQTEWNALDELADRFVLGRMESAGLKTTGTREDRAQHRIVLLTNPDAAAKYGDEFAVFVSETLTADNGPPEAQPEKAAKPAKSGFALI